MATTKKTKVIIWPELVDKALGPYEKRYEKLFSDYNKQVGKRPMSLKEKNDLWRNKYQKKYEANEKAEDAAYSKIYKKYHNSDNRPKEGYIIKFK